MTANQVGDCHIHRVAPDSGAAGRYWCLAHDATATARFGGRMPRCEGAYRSVVDYRRFRLDPGLIDGGIDIRGVLAPVYDTTSAPLAPGIHVLARRRGSGAVVVDQVFEAVELPVRRDLFEDERVVVTADTAVAHFVSHLLGRVIVGLFCPTCHTPHLDSDWYAVKPHRVHLCHGCNRMFREESRGISNPLELVRHELTLRPGRPALRAEETLDIRQSDFPGGLRIRASDTALLRTSSVPEREGIHVSGWTSHRSGPDLDGTYGRVRVDGVDLDEAQLRVFVAQSALFYLRGKIQQVDCPGCGDMIFDEGEAAFRPAGRRVCAACSMAFDIPGPRKRVVSNPFVATINALKVAAGARGTNG